MYQVPVTVTDTGMPAGMGHPSMFDVAFQFSHVIFARIEKAFEVPLARLACMQSLGTMFVVVFSFTDHERALFVAL